MLGFYEDKGVILLTNLNSFDHKEFLRNEYDQNIPVQPQKRAAMRFLILAIAGIIAIPALSWYFLLVYFLTVGGFALISLYGSLNYKVFEIRRGQILERSYRWSKLKSKVELTTPASRLFILKEFNSRAKTRYVVQYRTWALGTIDGGFITALKTSLIELGWEVEMR